MATKCIVYGGSFSPITISHEQVIKDLNRKAINTSAVLMVIPTYNPSYKDVKIDFESRFDMTKKLCTNISKNIIVNKIEQYLPTPSTTYSLISTIKKDINSEVTLAFGDDNLDILDKWYNIASLFKLLNGIIVIQRNHAYNNTEILSILKQKKITEDIDIDTIGIDKIYDGISSTLVRNMFKDYDRNKEEIKKYIPDIIYSDILKAMGVKL